MATWAWPPRYPVARLGRGGVRALSLASIASRAVAGLGWRRYYSGGREVPDRALTEANFSAAPKRRVPDLAGRCAARCGRSGVDRPTAKVRPAQRPGSPTYQRSLAHGCTAARGLFDQRERLQRRHTGWDVHGVMPISNCVGRKNRFDMSYSAAHVEHFAQRLIRAWVHDRLFGTQGVQRSYRPTA